MSVFHISLSKNSPTQRGALFVKVFSLLPVILKLAILIDKDLEQKTKNKTYLYAFQKEPLGFKILSFVSVFHGCFYSVIFFSSISACYCRLFLQ